MIRLCQQSSYDRRISYHTTVASVIIRLSHQLSYGCRISCSRAAAKTAPGCFRMQSYGRPDSLILPAIFPTRCFL
ncbi:MAG: hypothetical protein K2N13_09955 [Paraprevotella sp.]|nr:hypothetical protein [Paraprevotella sp.]